MITSFLGLHGNSDYVTRLSEALLQRGHEVHIIFSGDANRIRGLMALSESLPDALEIHQLTSGIGRIAPLFAKQTGRIGNYRSEILNILYKHQFDVIHLHDISMLGGVELIEQIHEHTNTVKLMSVQDHWLLCPLARLWQFNSQQCETPDCTRCTLAAGQLPQLWRMGNRLEKALDHLDALIFPSEHMRKLHADRGLELAQAMTMPPFLADGWSNGVGDPIAVSAETPYFVMSGELLKEHGMQTVLPLMKHTPSANLYIVGTGNYAVELHKLAGDASNIFFLGELSAAQRAQLIANAVAMIVPSLYQEPVGDRILEAYSLATPTLVRNRGALPEFVARSGGGMLFENSAELLDKMHLLLKKPQISKRMGTRAIREWRSHWSESNHLALYIDLIRSTQLRRDVQLVS